VLTRRVRSAVDGLGLTRTAPACTLASIMSEAVESIDTQEAVEALMGPEGPAAIIDFWAAWCGPCKVMAPQYEAVAAELAGQPIKFYKLDTERHPELARAFNVRSLPTLLLVHRGEIKDALVGAQPASAIRKKAEWLLNKAAGKGLWARLFG
jgi:thioredoxin